MLLFIARPDYFCDRDGYYDHIRKSHVLWEDISNLGASDTADEFCECVQVGIDKCPTSQTSGQFSISVVFICFCCCNYS